MINLGFIGAGRMAKVHMRSILAGVSGARIKAAADPYMSKETEEWLKNKGIAEIYSDYKMILQDSQIDAVMICSSTDTHASISIEAIHADKHIFCEKPVDRNFEKILPIIDLLKEKKNIKYQVGFNRRFDHNFRALRNVVDSGKLGDLHFLRICSRDSVTPPESYVKVSGGIFLDMMIHDIDMLRYLSKSDIEEVYAIGNVRIDQYFADAGDIDTAVVTFKLKNGAMAVIDNSRKAVYGYDQRAEIHGSKGSAEQGNDFQNTVSVFTADSVNKDGPVWDTLERYIPAYAAEVSSFIKAIKQDTETEVNVNDGLQSVLIALACKKSLDEKRPVKLSEIMK
jgi:myo-inositol 2-dehydrogenase/D-chiro-inositol 1-dehydrogenase